MELTFLQGDYSYRCAKGLGFRVWSLGLGLGLGLGFREAEEEEEVEEEQTEEEEDIHRPWSACSQ